MNAPYYGWFSQKAVDRGNQTSIYRREDGQEFEITSASQDPNSGPGWDDAVFLGVVGQFARHGRPDTTGNISFRERIEPIQHDLNFKKFQSEERLLRVIPQKHSLAQIEKILAAADEAGLVVDDCPAPIIVNTEKKTDE